MPPFEDLHGRQFGKLTVLRRVFLEGANSRRTAWEARCACGTVTVAISEKLKTGHTQSCGCLQRERTSQANRKHGMKGTREYHIWKNMKQRCYNPANPSFRNYGGRGITMCARWKRAPATFLKDMGPSPSPLHSVERKNNNRGYTPKNCIWATNYEQAQNTRRNTRITLDGETHTLTEWARQTKIPVPLLVARLGRLGWAVDRALRTPVKHR